MIENTHNYLNSLSVDAQIEELKGELGILVGFRARFRGTGAEWNLGVTFIRDSFLEEYIKDLAENQFDLDLDSWPVKHIDWKKAADELRDKYDGIIFKGIQYWIIEK